MDISVMVCGRNGEVDLFEFEDVDVSRAVVLYDVPETDPICSWITCGLAVALILCRRRPSALVLVSMWFGERTLRWSVLGMNAANGSNVPAVGSSLSFIEPEYGRPLLELAPAGIRGICILDRRYEIKSNKVLYDGDGLINGRSSAISCSVGTHLQASMIDLNVLNFSWSKLI